MIQRNNARIKLWIKMMPISQKREVMLEGNKVESKELLSEKGEIVIVHNEEEYKLRITGNRKLILTK